MVGALDVEMRKVHISRFDASQWSGRCASAWPVDQIVCPRRNVSNIPCYNVMSMQIQRLIDVDDRVESSAIATMLKLAPLFFFRGEIADYKIICRGRV